MGLGSSNITTGYNYWGSFAVAVCIGPVQTLHKICNGETVIWEGPLDSSSADGDGKSTITTTLGEMDFYWGTDTQNANAILNGMEIDFGSGPEAALNPAYRPICYAVCDDFAFGTQVTPPVLQFEVTRRTSGLTLTAHEIDDDAVLPEVIYDLLTNTLYGAGIPSNHIDTASFVTAAETLIDEGFGASPNLDERESVREIIGRILSYIDGALYLENGKIKIRLLRKESTAGLPSLDESDLLDEPEPTNEQFADTWNFTVVNFRDRENKWEDASEPYDDPAHAAIVGELVTRSFDFPWITKRESAQVVAKRLGIRGGVPTNFWRLRLKPEWSSLVPSDRFFLSYSAFGLTNVLMRVDHVRRGGPTEPEIELDVHEENTRDEANDYVPGTDTYSIPGTLDPDGGSAWDTASTTPRLSWLPTELKEGKADGLLVAMHRPDTVTLRASVWWTWDPLEQAYTRLDTVNAFPAKATFVCWHKIRTNNWCLRVEFDSDHDLERFDTLVAEALDLYATTGQRLYKTVGSAKDEHQVLSPWLARVSGGRQVSITGRVVDIEMEGEAFGTDDLALEQLAVDGAYPTAHIYFGRQEDFYLFTSDTLNFDRNAGNAVDDTAKVRYCKATTANNYNEEAIAAVTAVTYDRDLTTQCADGTFSTDWGARAVSTYEYFDDEGGAEILGESNPDYPNVEDIDEALGAIYAGTATAAQTLLAEHIDDVLGAMAAGPHTYYNT